MEEGYYEEIQLNVKGSEISQPAITDLLQINKCCPGTYQKFIETVIVKWNHKSKFSENLQKRNSEEVMSEYYSIIFHWSIESKARSFQYKILQHILTTNNLCYFFGTEIETPEHLFWLFSVTNSLWKRLLLLWNLTLIFLDCIAQLWFS